MKYRVAILSSLLCLLSSLTFGDEVVVDPNGSADFTTIQAAIDDVGTVAGDVVIVRPGTYVENINMNGKAITLRSTDPADPAVVTSTIISGEGITGSLITCENDEGSNTIISGFVITKGTGMVFSSYTMGGGMYVFHSSPTVTNCIFIDNDTSGGSGGGMANRFESAPTVTGCTFSGNTSRRGGGIWNENSNTVVTNCMFSGNTTPDGTGGGMKNSSSSPVVTNCTFSGNTARYSGAGMDNSVASPTVINCTFSGNTVVYDGGGMYNTESSPTVTNCTFSDNMAEIGSGMYNNYNSSSVVTNCAFNDNTATGSFGYGGGMYNNTSTVTMTYCTFNGNTANIGGGMDNKDSSPTVKFSSFCNNTPDDIDGDPLDPSSESNAFGYCVQPPLEPELFGDSDGDGDVDLADFAAFVENWLVGVE